MLLLLQVWKTYHETFINVYTVKLHVPSSAVLKCALQRIKKVTSYLISYFFEIVTRFPHVPKCECKSQQFLEMGHCQVFGKW